MSAKKMGDRRLSRRMTMTNINAGRSQNDIKHRNRRSSVASTSSEELTLLLARKLQRKKDDEAKAVEKENSLAWKVLSNTQMHSLLTLSVEEVERQLAEILQLTSYTTDLKEGTLLDYYVSAFWWAKEESFDAQQASGFFTVVHTLMENVKEKLTASENLSEYRKMLIGIGTDSKEINGGLDFLSLKHAKLISNYLETTLFQHYSLYYFLHHEEREKQIICTDLFVEVLPPAAMPYPPPLDEGLDEAVYQKHISPPEEEEISQPEQEGDEKVANANEDRAGDRPKYQDEASGEVDSDILADISVEEVKTVFDKVAKEMFSGLQDEITQKLKEREADIITRINRIHRIAET